jgi:hypothetical protein
MDQIQREYNEEKYATFASAWAQHHTNNNYMSMIHMHLDFLILYVLQHRRKIRTPHTRKPRVTAVRAL